MVGVRSQSTRRRIMFRCNNHWRISLVCSILLFVSAGCSTMRPQHPENRSDAARSITVRGLSTIEGEITLSSGVWAGNPFDSGSTSRPIVRLIEHLSINGDVIAGSAEETVLLLEENPGGSGTFISMALMSSEHGALHNILTIPIGDRIQIQHAKISNGLISLQVVEHSLDDPSCCPSDVVVHSWKWTQDTLQEQSPLHLGKLTPELLDSTEWELISWKDQMPQKDSCDITISFSDGRITGSSGCNRYFSSVSQSEIPGEISFGLIGATRMMCPPKRMQCEDRYLAILPSVRYFGFHYGLLALRYGNDSDVQTLFFQRMNSLK